MADRKISGPGALYLFGISRNPGQTAPRLTASGIDGSHPVQALPCGEFVCWVSAVDHAAFAKQLEANRENLDWLAVHSVRHQEAVGEIAAQTTMVPARFGTIFSGEAALRKDVQSRKPALERVFTRIADCDEWGVKVFANVKSTPVIPITAKSGREYLEQKAASVKKRPERNTAELEELNVALAKIALDSAPSGKVSGTQPNLVWQATFLVPRNRRKQWDAVLQEFVGRWDGQRSIEVNGPWPPYSFVSDAE